MMFISKKVKNISNIFKKRLDFFKKWCIIYTEQGNMLKPKTTKIKGIKNGKI